MGFIASNIRNDPQELSNNSPLGRTNLVFSDNRVGCLIQTGLANIRFYQNNALTGGAWDLEITVTGSVFITAATVDALDNVHICWRDGGDGDWVKYVALTHTGGGVYTLGTVVTVSNPGSSGYVIVGLDIDVLGTGSGLTGGTAVPIIAAHANVTASNDGKLVYFMRRRSDSTWIAVEKTLDNTQSPASADISTAQNETPLVSIARNAGGPTGVQCKFAVAIVPRRRSACQILGMTVDMDTGVEINSKVLLADVMASSRGHRLGQLFSTGAEQWTFGGLFLDPSGRMGKVAAVLDWNGLTFPVQQDLLASGTYTFSTTTFGGFTYRWNMGGVQYTNGRLVYIYQQNGSSGSHYVWVVPALVNVSSVDWSSGSAGITHTVPMRGALAGGCNRNFDKKRFFGQSIIQDGTNWQTWGYWNGTPSTALILDKPVNSSTVNTDQPIFQTVLDGWDWVLGGGIKFKPVYQAAASSDFVTGFRTFEPPDSAMTMSGTIEMTVPAIYELSQGTWYGRQRYMDEYGQIGPVGPTTTFTVSHPPSTSGHTPTAGQSINSTSPLLDWDFYDTSISDVQTAYQVVIERNDTFAVVLDTGKVASGATVLSPTISGALTGIQLRWKVRVWDSDDVVSAYSGYHTFTLLVPPTVTYASVEAGTPAPLVDWVFTPGTSPTQATYRVSIKRTGDGIVVYDTGTLTGTVTLHQVPTAVLAKGVSYTVTTVATDSAGLSDDAVYTYTPTWTGAAQPPFTVDTSRFESHGFNKISWVGTPAVGFIGWRIYSRVPGGEWTRVAGISGGPQNVIDFLARSAQPIEYTVVQVTDLDGALVESDYTTTITVTPSSSHYWLIDPDETGINEETHATFVNPVSTMLAHVVDDPFEEEYEEEMHKIIGRGVRREVGTRWGFKGEIRAQLRGLASLGPREERLRLEHLRSTGKEMYLRNPFGDLWRVAIGTLKYRRVAGVGTMEFTEVNLPYQEVS